MSCGTKTKAWFLACTFPDHLSGARYYVSPDKRLCACGVWNFQVGFWHASWAGFVPYQ